MKKVIIILLFLCSGCFDLCMDNNDCEDGFVCSIESCGDMGICIPKGNCFQVEDLVCGCDGLIYMNECYAINSGIGVDYKIQSDDDICYMTN